MRLIYIFVVFFILGFCITEAVKAEVPGRPVSHYVLDQTATLTQDEIQKIDSIGKSLEESKKTSFAILLIPTLAGEDIAQYSLKVFDQWKPGIPGVDKGALLVIAKNDHKFRVEVSRNLEGDLPDVTIKRVLEDHRSYFKANAFGDGILSIVQTLGSKVDVPQITPVPAKKDDSSFWALLATCVGVFGICISAVLMRMRIKKEEEARRLYLLAENKRFQEAEELHRKQRESKMAREREELALKRERSLDLSKSIEFSPAYKHPLGSSAGLSGAVIRPPAPKVEPVRNVSAVSRKVSTPSRSSRDYDYDDPTPIFVSSSSGSNYSSSSSSRSRDDDSSSISSSSSWSSSSTSDSSGGGSSSSWD